MILGEMRDKITFQKKVDNTDSPYVNTDYTDYVTVWAKTEYLKGSEFWSAKAVNAEQTVRFVIRHRKDITGDMRVVFDETSYDIISATPLTNKLIWLVVNAKEVKVSG